MTAPQPNPNPLFCADWRWQWPTELAHTGIALQACRFSPTDLAPALAADSSASQAHRLPLPHTLPAHLTNAAIKRQCEYLAGRWCVLQAQKNLKFAEQVPCIGADRAPQWPAGQVGSISHSHSQAVAIVADSLHWQGIGVDIEVCLSAARAQRLAGEILTDEELSAWQSLPESAQAAHVTLAFCLKEALFKTLYPLTQTRFYFHDAHVVLSSEATSSKGQAQLILNRELSPAWPIGSRVTAHWQWQTNSVLGLIALAHTETS